MAIRVPIMATRVSIMAIRVPIMATRVSIMAIRVPIMAKRVKLARDYPRGALASDSFSLEH